MIFHDVKAAKHSICATSKKSWRPESDINIIQHPKGHENHRFPFQGSMAPPGTRVLFFCWAELPSEPPELDM